MFRPNLNALDALPAEAKVALDGLSFVAVLGTLLDWLPTVASLLTVIWTLIRIYETRTVQVLVRRGNRIEIVEVAKPSDRPATAQIIASDADD